MRGSLRTRDSIHFEDSQLNRSHACILLTVLTDHTLLVLLLSRGRGTAAPPSLTKGKYC